MTHNSTLSRDINEVKIFTPNQLKSELSSYNVRESVFRYREAIRNILDGEDDRLLFIIGPCSIHDIEGGKEYALRLNDLVDKVKDRFLVIMRAYFEKPRTIVGWKGYIYDPAKNGSYEVNKGLYDARKFLLNLAGIDIPIATEVVNPLTIRYFDDLVSWVAIGARTVESQFHREKASDLDIPVGFKNGTSGNFDVALDAIESSSCSHNFFDTNANGELCFTCSNGNKYGHLVLRGGNKNTNYESHVINEIGSAMRKRGILERIIVDCAHGNSKKIPSVQEEILRYLLDKCDSKEINIRGIMVESNLEDGNQNYLHRPLKRGVSITDPCSSLEKIINIVLS